MSGQGRFGSKTRVRQTASVCPETDRGFGGTGGVAAGDTGSGWGLGSTRWATTGAVGIVGGGVACLR